MCKKGKQEAGSSSDITLINYTYIQYIYCIYNLFQSFATQKSTGLEVELENKDKLIHSSEGPRDLVHKKSQTRYPI